MLSFSRFPVGPALVLVVAQAALDRLIGDVEAFRGNKSQSDDITAVVVGPRAGS